MRALLIILATVSLLLSGCGRKQTSATSPQPVEAESETAELARLVEEYKAATGDEARQNELGDRLVELLYRQALRAEELASVPSEKAVEFVAEIEAIETTAKVRADRATMEAQQIRVKVVDAITDAAGAPRAGDKLIIRTMTQQPLLMFFDSLRSPWTRRFSESDIGQRLRFVYHCEFATDYAGRFSAYQAAPESKQGACEFAATISDVRAILTVFPDNKWWLITFTVSRVLDAPGGEVSKGDVFYLRVHSPSGSLYISTKGPWEGEYVLRFSELPTPGSELDDDVWISKW